ncbi:MAG: pilus assembly protein PilM [Deltaproteobacteria bacterium]|jgi:Tfp pilus assembly PilM family ATPase|nr:pilus assembly protein PilM [Deltaproteobacteria bacterium]MCL5880135.1 pilus assembly protein PilM [Deltaproteobacteria bacterium]MDA8304815.1 pilus assembly protein PilM [Deltaproteobacteria bacterium]
MFFAKFFTAIEIDHEHFKILEVVKKGRGYFLNNFVNAKFPGLNHEDISGVAINLSKLMNDNKISKKNVFANINDNAVHSYNFELPDMPRNDLNKAVEYEIKKLIPFPISSCIFDYIFAKNGSTLNITAFASKAEDINNFKEIFASAGIKLKSIECKTASVYNNIMFLSNNKVDHLLLCDIGEKAAKIVIVRDNAVNFERTIEGINLKDLNDDESALLIGDELKKTVDFYFAGKSIAPIDSIILTGIYSENEGFNGKIMYLMRLKTYSISIISLLKERKIFLSKRLIKYDIDENYDFFKPLEEMWATFGLIVNR